MITIDLSGKTSLVTGAGQGLGRATAAALHAAGCTVAVNYFADPGGHNARLAEQACAALGSRAFPVAADIRRPAEVAAMMEAIAGRCGRLDILVNNAAIVRDRTVKKMSDEEWQAVIDTNLTGVFNVCRAAMPHFAEGGRIVNVASISGVVGLFGQANYAAAKAGVIGLTKVLAREVAGRGITVNAVAPGVVLTEMGKAIPDDVRDTMLAAIPLGRFGEPDDVAHAILFLASDMAGYITGQTLHVNGGWWV